MAHVVVVVRGVRRAPRPPAPPLLRPLRGVAALALAAPREERPLAPEAEHLEGRLPLDGAPLVAVGGGLAVRRGLEERRVAVPLADRPEVAEGLALARPLRVARAGEAQRVGPPGPRALAPRDGPRAIPEHGLGVEVRELPLARQQVRPLDKGEQLLRARGLQRERRARVSADLEADVVLREPLLEGLVAREPQGAVQGCEDPIRRRPGALPRDLALQERLRVVARARVRVVPVARDALQRHQIPQERVAAALDKGRGPGRVGRARDEGPEHETAREVAAVLEADVRVLDGDLQIVHDLRDEFLVVLAALGAVVARVELREEGRVRGLEPRGEHVAELLREIRAVRRRRLGRGEDADAPDENAHGLGPERGPGDGHGEPRDLAEDDSHRQPELPRGLDVDLEVVELDLPAPEAHLELVRREAHDEVADDALERVEEHGLHGHGGRVSERAAERSRFPIAPKCSSSASLRDVARVTRSTSRRARRAA